MVTVVAATQLKVFAQLDGLRRAPGPQGEMRSKLVNDGAFKVYLSEDGTYWSKFPRSQFSPTPFFSFSILVHNLVTDSLLLVRTS